MLTDLDAMKAVKQALPLIAYEKVKERHTPEELARLEYDILLGEVFTQMSYLQEAYEKISLPYQKNQ